MSVGNGTAANDDSGVHITAESTVKSQVPCLLNVFVLLIPPETTLKRFLNPLSVKQ